MAPSNAVDCYLALVALHEVALLLPGVLDCWREFRKPDLHVKSPFKNIWLKRIAKKKALCRQNTSARHMSRSEPQATGLWPLPCSVWLCLALQPQFIWPFPLLTTFLPQWPPFRFSVVWAITFSGSFVFLVFYAYSCFRFFLFFKPELSSHFLTVVFTDLYLNFVPPHPLSSASFPDTRGLKVWSGTPEGLQDSSQQSMTSKLVSLQ